MVRELDTTHSSLTVLQRIRSQIIEYLELASSFEAQRSYQSRVPIAQVPNEVIVGWEDWVADPRDPALAEPVFLDQ